MKKNNKGFTLIETLLVSTFVIGTLVYLYVQFSNIKKVYDVSFTRDTVPSLYYTLNIINYLENTDISSIKDTLTTQEYVAIEDCMFTVSSSSYCKNLMRLADVKKVLVVKDDLTTLKQQLQATTTNPFSETMYQYILSLSTSKIQKNRVIVEYNNGTVSSLQMK